MPVNLTNKDIGTRYALQEDFNNGFVGRDRQVVIQTDDPKGYRPVIMDGVTQGGKSKVALVADLSGFETTDHASATYATKTEVTSGLAGKAPTSHTHTIANITDLQTKLDDLATKIETTGGLPLGHHYAWPFGTIPANSIQCNGSTYSRTLYADFWQWLQDNSLVKTDREWHRIASSNNWYCPYYSDGDGSTTFRTPKFAPFMQVAIASGNVGNYHEAGVPNIKGRFTLGNYSGCTFGVEGPAFEREEDDATYSACLNANDATWVSLDASRCNGAFGNSDTVQPESQEWMICVVVMGVATNVGSTDVGNVMSAVAQVQANPNLQGQAHIVETWKSGSSWYRVWSDGFIEQGDTVSKKATSQGEITISLNKPMTTSTYYTDWSLYNTSILKDGTYNRHITSVSNTNFSFSDYIAWDSKTVSVKWYACGY